MGPSGGTVEIHPAPPLNPFGTSGIARSRVPVASQRALPIAGATATIGASPAPAEGMSLRLMSVTLISGKSLNLGTR